MTLQSLRKPYFSKVQFCRHPVRRGYIIECRLLHIDIWNISDFMWLWILVEMCYGCLLFSNDSSSNFWQLSERASSMELHMQLTTTFPWEVFQETLKKKVVISLVFKTLRNRAYRPFGTISSRGLARWNITCSFLTKKWSRSLLVLNL